MALIATLVVMFYTTASDTMVRPKLQFSKWEKMDLNSTVWSSYANPTYVNDTCTTPITADMDWAAGESCLAIQYSGDCKSNSIFISLGLAVGTQESLLADYPSSLL